MPKTPAPSVRDRLIATAFDLFYREGIQAVGVQRVIEEADAAKASLYAHFPSKDDLVEAYLDRMAEATRTHLEAAIATAGSDPRHRLLALFDAIEASRCTPGFRGCPFINAASELADPTHAGHAAIARHRQWLRDRIEELTRATGVTDASLVAQAILLLLDGASTSTMLDRNADAVLTAKKAAERLLAR